MTGRERFLTVINNEKPDHLPCQVHSWMDYYLKTYLGGMDQYAAYDKFNMDPVIYVQPEYIYDDSSWTNWQVKRVDLGLVGGNPTWKEIITTPEGELTKTMSQNEFTLWESEHLLKSEHDFEIWSKYLPAPANVNWDRVIAAKKKIGDRGIVRSEIYSFGQGGQWQGFCTLYGTEPAIMLAFDKPDWLKAALEDMLQKQIHVLEIGGKIELDLVETGGGAASSTVISPAMFEEFCLPYAKRHHEMLHNCGAKVVYHLCGGLMPLLEYVVASGADVLETMTPVAMGGDCDLAKAQQLVGDKIAFIGGFDQQKGFENGNPQLVKDMVEELFAACPDGGYICCPSDHFFFGDVENLQAFADVANQCVY